MLTYVRDPFARWTIEATVLSQAERYECKECGMGHDTEISICNDDARRSTITYLFCGIDCYAMYNNIDLDAPELILADENGIWEKFDHDEDDEPDFDEDGEVSYQDYREWYDEPDFDDEEDLDDTEDFPEGGKFF